MRPKINFSGVSRGVANRTSKEKGTPHLQLPDGIKMFKLPVDKTVTVNLDVLPYPVTNSEHREINQIGDGSHWYRLPYLIHNVEGGDGFVVCPKSIGKKCPICAKFEYHRSINSEWADFKHLQAKSRSLFAVSVLNVEGVSPDDILVWDISDYMFMDKVDMLIGQDESYTMFASPDDDGLTFKILVLPKALNGHKYGSIERIDFVGRKKGEGIPQEMLDEVPEMDNMLLVKSYAELEAYVSDDFDNAVQEEVIPEVQTRRGRGAVSTPAPEPVEDVVQDEPAPPVVSGGRRGRGIEPVAEAPAPAPVAGRSLRQGRRA